LPPLRERKTDSPLLVRRFTPEFAREHDRPFKGITPEALQILVDAEWPGNIRQLRNLIESMVVLAPEGEIRASDIPKDIREHGSMLPMRLVGPGRDVGGLGGPGGAGAQELGLIFRSLVELKLQVEELRRRLEERPPHVEVIEVGPGSGVSALTPGEAAPASAVALSVSSKRTRRWRVWPADGCVPPTRCRSNAPSCGWGSRRVRAAGCGSRRARAARSRRWATCPAPWSWRSPAGRR